MTAFAGTYDSVDAAETDYQAVMALYYEMNLMDTFDAAVITRTEKGKVKIVDKHEQPTRQAAGKGARMGLAAGLVAALLGAGMLATSAVAGGAIGALAGHAVGGMSRGDLKDLGELLDNGQSGLLVVAATDVGDRVACALKSAQKVVNKQIKADDKELKKALKEAA